MAHNLAESDNEGDSKLFQQSVLSEIFNLIFHDDRANLPADEFIPWKAVLGETHHPDICGLVQKGRVSHVRVEIHISPASESFFEHSDPGEAQNVGSGRSDGMRGASFVDAVYTRRGLANTTVRFAR
jgi:hypothetical protein